MAAAPFPGTFNGAVELIRDFYRRYPKILETPGPAHIAIEVLRNGSPTDKANAEKLCVNGRSPAVPVVVTPDLRSTDKDAIACVLDGVLHRTREARNFPGFTIEFAEIEMTEREASAAVKVMRAMLLHREDGAPILLPPVPNMCWRRLVTTKELGQILRGTVIPPGKQSVQTQLTEAFQILSSLYASKELSGETFALVCAIELLIPWQRREAFHEIATLEGGRLLAAKAFMVPLYFVELYFDTRYRLMSVAANTAIT